MSATFPPPFGPDWKVWARQLSAYLANRLPRLQYKTTAANPSENGVIQWDDVAGYPVVSKNGVWRQVILEDGHFDGAVTTQQTAAAANTAYALTYTPAISEGIATGTPASRIVFDEAGHYMVSFSAQITSASGSSITFYFWPRINGVDLSGSTMVNTLKNNGASLVVSRASAFVVNAGDYLEVMWAASSTQGSLTADAATAFCPVAPASTISITRLHA
jgi:hypothetical protein